MMLRRCLLGGGALLSAVVSGVLAVHVLRADKNEAGKKTVSKTHTASTSTSSISKHVDARSSRSSRAGVEKDEPKQGLMSSLRTLLEAQRESNNFIPACVTQMKTLSATIDHSYTDQQMQQALENECDMANDQPLILDDGFDTWQACQHFTREVTKARMQFLEEDTDEGYLTVCKNYWVHMYAKELPKKLQPAEGPRISLYQALAILGGGVGLVFVVNKVLVKI